MGTEILIMPDGSRRECWVPIPDHWLTVSVYDTVEKVRQRMREMYPLANRPDLWEKYPDVFGE